MESSLDPYHGFFYYRNRLTYVFFGYREGGDNADNITISCAYYEKARFLACSDDLASVFPFQLYPD